MYIFPKFVFSVSVQHHAISNTWGPGLRLSSKSVDNPQRKTNWCDIHTIITQLPSKINYGRRLSKNSSIEFVAFLSLATFGADFMHLRLTEITKSFVMHLYLTSYVFSFQFLWLK